MAPVNKEDKFTQGTFERHKETTTAKTEECLENIHGIHCVILDVLAFKWLMYSVESQRLRQKPHIGQESV